MGGGCYVGLWLETSVDGIDMAMELPSAKDERNSEAAELGWQENPGELSSSPTKE